MSKQRFDLVDKDDQTVGFVVVNLPTEFNHVVPTGPLIAEGPLTDAAFMVVSLGSVTAAGLLLSLTSAAPLWVAPLAGVVASIGLTAVRIISNGRHDEPDDKPQELTIKVEAWTDEGLVVLEEIRDKTITLDDLRLVAKAIIKDGANFSRPALCAKGLSQPKYHKINAEFQRLHFAHKASGNNYTLSPRAMAFLRKVERLPY